MRPRLTRYRLLLIGTAIGAVAICVFTRGPTRWLSLAALCSASGLSIGLGVSFPQWQMFGASFCQAKIREKRVALTFDDGPDDENTPALLTLLAERGVRATFFVIGHRAARRPELVTQITAAGHAVENHTFHHHPLTNLFSIGRLRAELTLAQAEIQRVTGRAPVFFRPPAGLTNPRIFRAVEELGLKLAGYTARGLDRRNDPPGKIAARLLARLQPGAIFLLHDAGVPRERLLEVVTLVLDKLSAAGYRCVRLDELLNEHEKMA